MQALFFIPYKTVLLKPIMLLIFLYIVNLFRTLIFAVLIYLVIRWINRLITPKSSEGYRANSQQQGSKKEGETTIRYNKKGEKIINKDEGEYVDFEEVD